MPTSKDTEPKTPRLIASSTLVDIARHGDKVLKAARLSSKLGYTLAQNKINMLDTHSGPVDAVLAFEEDLAATAKDIKQLGLVVDSLHDNHVAPELKGVDENFITLFGDSYDPDTFTLSVYGVKLHPGSGVSAADADNVKAMVYHAAVGPDVAAEFPYKDYKAHLKNIRHAKRNKPTSESTLAELINYSYARSSIQDWAPFTSKIIEMAESNADLRSSLDIKARKVLDRKVLGVSQAMVDGVAKSSTYIIKGSGRDQVSTRHKKHESVISQIEQLVEDIPYIRAVEIDADTDVEKFHDMMIDIKNMNLNVADAFELKSRKLGNYRACGLMATRSDDGGVALAPERGFASGKFKIVAVDVNHPTSLAHEITHFADVNEQDPVRNRLVRHFSEKIDREKLNEIFGGSEHYLSYYLSHREVVARLGEIGFILNKHDYQENESLSAFYHRVADMDPQENDEKLRFEVALSKPLSVYMGDNPLTQEIYFNMADWQPAELAMLKDYTHSYFYEPRPDVLSRLNERIQAGELSGLSKHYHEARKDKKKRVIAPTTDILEVKRQFGRLPAKSLTKTYLAGLEEGIFADGEFLQGLAMSIDRLGRGGATKVSSLGRVSGEDIGNTFNAIAELLKSIDPAERPGDAIVGREIVTGLAMKFSLLSKEQTDLIPSEADQSRFNVFFDEMANAIPTTLWEDGRAIDSNLVIKTYGLNKYGLSLLDEFGAADNLKDAYARYENMNIDPPAHQLAAATDFVKMQVIKSLAFDAFSAFESRPSESAHDFAWSMEQVELREAWGAEAKGVAAQQPFMEGPLTKLLAVSEIWGALTNHEADIVSALVGDNALLDVGISDAQLERGVRETVEQYRELLPPMTAMRFSADTTSLDQLMTRTEHWFSGRSERGGWLDKGQKISDLLAVYEDKKAERDVSYRRNGVGPSPLLTLLTVADKALAKDGDKATKLTALCLKVSDGIKSNPVAFKDVHAVLETGVTDYKKSINYMGEAARSCHPWVRNIAEMSIEDDIANLDAPHKPSDAFLHCSVAATVGTMMNAAVSATPLCVISGGIGNNYVYAGDNTRDEMSALALSALHAAYALSSAGLPKQAPSEVYGYDAAQPDIEKARAAIDTFIAAASSIDVAMTKQALQAFAAMPMINFPGRFSVSGEWMDKQLRAFEQAAQWVNLPLAEDKARYVGLDEWVDSRLSALRDRAPELTVEQHQAPEIALDQVPEPTPDEPLVEIEHVKRVDKVEPYNMIEINQEVPKAEEGELRPEHQMRMF
jgi:hypothetical protein